jgi:predicted double-glycine peptidase
LVLVYRRGSDDSHAVVVYGISGIFVNVMDPEHGRYRWFTSQWLSERPAVLVAWPNW